MGNHNVMYWTQTWLLTSHLDVDGVGCAASHACLLGLLYVFTLYFRGVPKWPKYIQNIQNARPGIHVNTVNISSYSNFSVFKYLILSQLILQRQL